MRFVLALALLGLTLGVARGQTRDVAAEPAYPLPEQTAKPKPKAKAKAKAKASKAKPEASKEASIARPAPLPPLPPDTFGDLPADERAAIRAALLWASGEDGKPGDGESPMVAAIKAYQKRNKTKVTGVLTAAERGELLAAAKTHHDRFGWTVVVDPATGIRIGIPAKLAPQAENAAHGTRWSSRHGEVAIETFRIKTDRSLDALFDAQKKEPPIRKVDSSHARGDGFFLSGLQGLKHFIVRARLRGGELRGYTMLYDQAMAGIVLPVLPAMAHAFAPFPDGAAPIAALSKPVAYGSGVIVSARGHVVTDRHATEGCDVIAVPGLGNAERIATDAASGLALLRVYGRHRLSAAVLAPPGPPPRELSLVGIADPHVQNGAARRSTLKAKLAEGDAIRLSAPVPLAGFSGAAALDAQGRVLGIVELRNAELASLHPTAPPVRLVPAAAIRDFLSAHRVAPAQDSGGPSAIVRVICVRH